MVCAADCTAQIFTIVRGLSLFPLRDFMMNAANMLADPQARWEKLTTSPCTVPARIAVTTMWSITRR